MNDLSARYDLAPTEEHHPKYNGLSEFIGAHNAGNDAIQTFKVTLASALDSRIPSIHYNGHEMVERNEKTHPRTSPIKHPFLCNSILVAVDLEFCQHDSQPLTELGLA